MDFLLEEEKSLVEELEDVIKREEVLISVLSTLSGDDADDVEQDLRELREERQNLTHQLNLIRSKVKLADTTKEL